MPSASVLHGYSHSDLSFLLFPSAVVLNLNPFFLLEDDPTPARNNQVTRAASLVVSALNFVRAVRREELAPDTVRGIPLCMSQYSRLFGTARVPTESGCIIQHEPSAKHCVVMCRGQFYWFDVLDDNHDIIMTEKDISINLRVIVEDAQHTPIQEAAKSAIGVLSTENRKVWSGLRDILTKDGDSNNADCLKTVDTALFILCLDYTEPSNTADLCANMVGGTNQVVKGVQSGTCTNRWYDKLQIIVCKNGSAGINFEHTGVDGHTVLRFASDIYTDTILRFARSINGQAPSMWATSSPDPAKRDPRSFGNVSTTPRRLEWDVSPEISTALRFAESHLADLLRQHEFEVLDFQGYGKNFITSMGFSPDAFIQMAMQAAYYGLYGRVECTYEPAMTKAFFHGRTEAVRSVTNEAVNFVKTFWGDNPPEKKAETLQKATEKHTAITRDCSMGQGFDRHLYALYCLWQRSSEEGLLLSSTDSNASIDSNSISNGRDSPIIGTSPNTIPVPRNAYLSSGASEDGSVSGQGAYSVSGPTTTLATAPAIFSDGGWDKINNIVLSTSNCGNPSLRHFGFGPTSADGFAIGYIIKDDTVSFCASSKHRQTARLMYNLELYLLEIRKVLRMTSGSRRTTSPRTSRARETEMMSERFQTQTDNNRLGRVVSQRDTETPTTDSGELDDDGMGGCKF